MAGPTTRPVTPGLLGPVFRYELTRLGRQRTTFILRCLYLVVLVLVVYVAYQTWSESLRDYSNSRSFRYGERRAPRLSDYSRFGTFLFGGFMPIQFFVLAFLTPGLVAGTIAVEKERKTLEFMLATDLRNREIVFGKLVARLVTLLMYAVAGLPVIGIAMMFGGIDPNLLLAGYGATVLTIFSLASLSVFFSVMQRKPRDAIALTYVVAFAYLALTFFAGIYLKFALPNLLTGPLYLFGEEVNFPRIADWVAGGNPIYAAMHAAGPARIRGSSPLPDLVVRYTLFHIGGGILLLTLAIWKLRSVALFQAYGGTGKKKAKKETTARAKPAVGVNPVLWREMFCETPRGMAWLVLQVLLLVCVFIWPVLIFLGVYTDFQIDSFVLERVSARFDARHWQDFVEGISAWVRVATGLITFLVCLAVALRGAGAVTAEKDKDTWVSLVASPVTTGQVVWGKWWGCVFGQRRLLFFLFLVWAFGLVVGAVHPAVLVPLVLYLAVYLTVFAWAGMLCSANARNTTVATLRALVLAGFMVGGHMIVDSLCCIWPLSLGPGSNRVAGYFASAFVGQIPPFVMGWLALPGFDRPHMGIFHPDDPETIGPFAMLLGFAVWTGLAVAGYARVTERFRRAMNRQPDGLPPVQSSTE
jgi:ABC-type transport system involved in multi-copper enzyme maturation permease subunit